MSVRELLQRKSSKLIACRPEDTVETVASILTTSNIGALPVRNAERRLVGLISERDIIHGFATHGARVLTMKVADLMTAEVVTCKPEDDVKQVGAVMNKRHFRHLPVVDKGELVGFISLRDVLETRLQETELEVNVLRDYAVVKR